MCQEAVIHWGWLDDCSKYGGLECTQLLCTHHLHVHWLYLCFLITFPHCPLWHRQSSFRYTLHVRICSTAWQSFLATVWLCCMRCLNACFSLLCPSHASTRKHKPEAGQLTADAIIPVLTVYIICFCFRCLPWTALLEYLQRDRPRPYKSKVPCDYNLCSAAVPNCHRGDYATPASEHRMGHIPSVRGPLRR